MKAADLQLAWRNLWRNRRRSLLSIGGIGFAGALLVLVLSFQANQYQLMLRAAVESGTGHLQVQPEGYGDDPRIWVVMTDPAAIEAEVLKQPRILAATPRSEGFALLASERASIGAMVVGVRPETEVQLSNVAKTMREGLFLGAGDFDGVVLGRLLAINLGVATGDVVTILGSARDGSVAAGQAVVRGVFETGQPELDRGMVYVPLAFFDEVFRMEGGVHRLLVKADGLWWLDEVVATMHARLPSVTGGVPVVVRTWNELLPGLLDAIKLDFAFAVVMFSVLVLVVAFSILNTFIMTIHERTREFGVMMAIGTTPWRLVRVVMIESAILAWLGGVAGVLIGSGVTALLMQTGIDFGKEAGDYMAQFGLPARMYPELSWPTAVIGPTIVCVVTLLSAAVPALRVRRMRPVEAMHAP